ncbi:MAG: N-acetyltransferase [Chloroflexota bacterium]
MKNFRFTTTNNPDLARLQPLLQADPQHPHIHLVDMPYRLTSTWQEFGCEVGLWEHDGELVAWAVFMPPWWNVDYAIHPSLRGSELEREMFAWGAAEMQRYATRANESFYGSVEFFANTPNHEQTLASLQALGFQKFDWSVLRLAIDLSQPLPQPTLPAGLVVRPLHGLDEVEQYVAVHRAAFDSNTMTVAWRERTLAHPAYQPTLDLAVVDEEKTAVVGFCICWLANGVGQFEPLGVHPDYQGQGLGRALELTALHTLRDHGAKQVHVDHGSWNEAAVSLSLKTGFKQINDAQRHYLVIEP